MKLNKIILFASLALMSMFATSCSDDDDYAPGKPAGSYNVSFPEEQSCDITLSPEAKSFKAVIKRANGSGELTVPINKLAATDAIFSVPESVTFANGETEKEITIECAESMEMFKNYNCYLSIPEEYTQPYSATIESPNMHFSVIKEDYTLWGTGKWDNSEWNGTDEEPVVIFDVNVEYSEIKKLYRIKQFNGYGSGTGTIFFKWNGEAYTYSDEDKDPAFCFTDENGNISKNPIDFGQPHPTYGTVYVSWINDDPDSPTEVTADGKISFYFEYTVSAGSFGACHEILQLKKK